MKQSVIAYVTALTNVHADALKKIPANVPNVADPHRGFINELNALLDFVEDIPEEKPTVINLTVNSGEIEELKNTINVLEEHKEQMFKYQSQLKESLKNMYEIEINLHKKIEALVKENEQLKQNKKVGGKIDG